MKESLFFECRSVGSTVNKNLYERYKVNYIESVDLNSCITIRCSSIQNARELEGKLEKDFIHTQSNNPGKVIQILSRSRDNFMGLFLAKDDSYIMEELNQKLHNCENRIPKKYQI